MKILRVIVDDLPASTSRCRFAKTGYDMMRKQQGINCRFRDEPVWMNIRQLVDERCPDCPLRLEHDNAKIANEVM